MGRQRCSECERPASVCLCEQLPSPPLQTTRTSVVVLQHPHEARHKLSTLPILSKCLANCHILRGRRFQQGCSPLLDFFFNSHPHSPSSHALLLFPAPSAQLIGKWYDQSIASSLYPRVISPSQDAAAFDSYQYDSRSPRVIQRLILGHVKQGNAVTVITDESMQACKSSHAKMCTSSSDLSNTQGALDSNFCQQACGVHDANSFTGFPHIVLIAVDATWQHAQEMIKSSAPYLDKFVVPVCLPFDPAEEGSCMANSELIIRKEPFKGCMTTLEAIACCLKVLEPNGVEIHERLLHVLRCTVRFQATNIVSHKLRMKKQSKSMATNPGDILSQ